MDYPTWTSHDEAELVDMPNLQFQRSKMRHSRWDKANRPEAIARRNAAADERRMAMPPPIYPVDVQPGQLVGRITIELFGLQHVRLHDLRHTAATDMVNAGADLATVGAVLGHKSSASTKRYAHHGAARLLAAMGTIGQKVPHGQK